MIHTLENEYDPQLPLLIDTKDAVRVRYRNRKGLEKIYNIVPIREYGIDIDDRYHQRHWSFVAYDLDHKFFRTIAFKDIIEWGVSENVRTRYASTGTAYEEAAS